MNSHINNFYKNLRVIFKITNFSWDLLPYIILILITLKLMSIFYFMEYFSKNDDIFKMNNKMNNRELETNNQIFCNLDLFV